MKNVLKNLFTISLSVGLVISSAQAIFAQNFSNSGPSNAALTYIKEDHIDESVFTKEAMDQKALLEASFPVNLDPNKRYSAEDPSNYTLGITDVISIQVQRHPEVSGQYIINSEGKIQYDFVGDVKIEGLTKDEVREVLVERLSSYIMSPEVLVIITGYNSKIVYIIGEVGRPGKIFMRGDTIMVREALVQAGLPQLTGKMKDGRLITPSDDGHPITRKVNVYNLLFKGDLRENLVMNPGDTLYLPPTFLTKAMRVMRPVAAPMGLGRSMATGF